jgi:NADH-quinone oxidoreductase subunit L
MRPGQYLTRSLVFVDNRGVDGAVGRPAAASAGSPAGAPLADRVRPLLRHVHAGRVLVVALGVLAVRI